eukprot:TRINITY_DN21398_c0_g1_i2.p1 TRINITY_DN21398_c0_g1~~TRINITY_DN21398_c0_g1_i2.p1  ORF type:complete len:168 (+),score=24.98 TRINITY_DN21398_c0_g1_i2:37-504(+)
MLIFLVLRPEYTLFILSACVWALVCLQPESVFGALPSHLQPDKKGKLDSALSKALSTVQDFIDDDVDMNLRQAHENVKKGLQLARILDKDVHDAPKQNFVRLYLAVACVVFYALRTWIREIKRDLLITALVLILVQHSIALRVFRGEQSPWTVIC